MAINLAKGQRIDIGLQRLGVGLGWDPKASVNQDDFDLDASAFLLAQNGQVPTEDFFVFYGSQSRNSENQPMSPDGSVNFGQVKNSFIRIYNQENQEEILKYELEEDFSIETAIEFGRLYKRNGAWRFEAIGNGVAGGLAVFVKKYAAAFS